MRKIIFTVVLFLASSAILAQGSVDALRYSTNWYGGNARYLGMGGAFGALGANISVLSTNPAGIGLYNSPEFSITSSSLYSKSESVYNGEMASDSRLNTSLGNIGIVLTKEYLNIQPEGKWQNFQFGFGLNQLQNFNKRTYISGPNTSNSIADMYAALANGTSVQDIEDDPYGDYAYDLNPAWWSYLFDYTGNGNYVSNAPQGGVHQGKLIESWGTMNEINLTFGANYDNRLYLGASIGIPYYNYEERSNYSENALNEMIPDSTFRSINIREKLSSKGTGFNLKLGMIYRAQDWLRFGFAIHTPTFYTQIKEQWDVNIQSHWDNYQDESNSSPVGNYEYDFTTPFRAMASVAFIIGNYGLISADYEVVDYSSARLKASDYSFTSENDDISMLYKTTGNLRIGTEWRVQNFSLRGGFNYLGSPYKNNLNDASATSYSFGIGYHERNYYLDMALVRTNQSEDYYLYGYNNINANKAVNSYNHTNFVVTYGFKF